MAAVLFVWVVTGFAAYKTIFTRRERNLGLLMLMLLCGPFTYVWGILCLLFRDID